ncbi:MAG TPA: hypothetical protein VEE85_00790 [Candidatus Bathyarchaeia archaeon]|nr:hypothetical protein [Candidatus Bathyarchaeia archaeon]
MFPVVDQLVLTCVVDNSYDIFAKGGTFGDVTVQRTPVPYPYGSGVMLLEEHGLAYHLAPFEDETIAKTVAALKEIDPDYYIPMHCTGFRALAAIHREMPTKLILPATGTRVVFGA